MEIYLLQIHPEYFFKSVELTPPVDQISPCHLESVNLLRQEAVLI